MHARCHMVEAELGATGNVDDTVPLSRLSPRPTEIFPTALADPDDDCIVVMDIKPAEIEILKQQSHPGSSLPQKCVHVFVSLFWNQSSPNFLPEYWLE